MELYIDDQENLIEVSDYAYDPESFEELEEDHKDDSEYSYNPDSFENLHAEPECVQRVMSSCCVLPDES